MNRFRAFGVSIVLVVGGLLPVAGGAAPACAATENSAALVVDTGGSATAYCVELPSGSTDGIDLIKLAAKQYGLSYNLGYGGQAVCALNGAGVTDSGDCFAQMPDYWGYWIGNGSGGWNWASVGAGSISVDPGDVQGWSWGSGKDGSSHPAPPNTDYGDVCKVKEPADRDDGSNGGTGAGSGDTNGTADGQNRDSGDTTDRAGSTGGTGEQDADPDAGEGHQAQDGAGGQAGDRTTTDPSAAQGRTGTEAEGAPAEPVETSPVVLAAPLASGAGDSGTDGPPMAGLAALGIVALLGAGGWAMASGNRGGRHRAGHVKRKD